MMKQSYTSFLNIVHKKANIHIFVIKDDESTSQQVNESTGQQVNESTSQRVNESTSQQVNELRSDGSEGSDWVRWGGVKRKTPIKSVNWI